MYIAKLEKLIDQASSISTAIHTIFDSIKLAIFKLSDEEITKWNTHHKHQIHCQDGVRKIIVATHTLSIKMQDAPITECFYCHSKNIQVSDSEVECLECGQAYPIDPFSAGCTDACKF